MDKTYNNQDWEDRILQKWQNNKSLTPPPGSDAKRMGLKPFTVIMPPPNANDPLHVGHAMFVTVEDILVRYHRMLGEACLWLPGTDHAGIETQFVFEKKLAKEDKSRFNFDRETLYRMIWDYVQDNSGVAVDQMKRLGASADWSRFKFSLDPEVVNFVMETFEKMAEDGYIYRGERLVNYCTKCGTSYSELEVDYEERNDKLFYIIYPIVGGGEIVVATTRPETMFGDVAVAVNPKDSRYKLLIERGAKVKLPLANREIPIIGDAMVEKDFGTGAVKITPAHDANDFAVAERQGWNLSEILLLYQAIDMSGRLTEICGDLKGKRVKEARDETVAKLENLGLMEKIVDHNHSVGLCYRCHSPIEPLPLAQFFIKTKPLAEKALLALDNKETVILGAGREKILRQWLGNIRDWNISRQIVWGIRIPVWYKIDRSASNISVLWIDSSGKLYPYAPLRQYLDEGHSLEDIKKGVQRVFALPKPNGPDYVVSRLEPSEGEWIQETDTFDTWFSSGQWPVVTLKTAKPGDFEFYYPTSVLETGYDILPIWVMRMMLFGIYLTGKSPFKYVYLHGLVRDEKGQKMSKSLGNVINPLTLVEKYGADAVRMALVMSTTAGQDSSTGEGKVRGMRNFANKIWNATRFVKEYSSEEKTVNNEFSNKMKEIVNTTTKYLDGLKVGLAAEYVYSEFWHWYCDVVIEESKSGKFSSDQLRQGLVVFLKLLHPFVPFVTEAAFSELTSSESEEALLMSSLWPKETSI